MMMDTLIRSVLAMRNPSVLGLDTRIEYFPPEFAKAYDLGTLEGAAEAITDYNHILIDALHDIVPAVKVQAAYYEMYGVPGMLAPTPSATTSDPRPAPIPPPIWGVRRSKTQKVRRS